MKTLSPEKEQVLSNYLKSIDWTNPDYNKERRAFATVIVDEIKKDVYSQELVSHIATVRTFGPGEELQFKTTEGLVAYVIEPGSYAPRSQVTNTVITLPRKRVVVATELDLNQLRSGRYGDVSDFKMRAAEQLLGAQNSMIWDLAYGAVTATTTDSNYATIASADTVAVKKAALDAAITYLEDQTNAGAKAIIGRFTSLSWIDDIDNTYLPDDMRKKIYESNGLLAFYKGIPVIRLKSFLDPYGVQKISANHVLVIGEDVMKMGIVDPGLEVFEKINGTTNYSWEIAFWMEMGAAVIQSKRMYHIEIS
jgi:hypothetical protein